MRDGSAPGAAHRVDVLWARTVPAGTLLDALSGPERERLSRLASAGDRDRFATSRVVAHVAVASVTGLAPGQVEVRTVCGECGGSDHGAPRARFAAGEPVPSTPEHARTPLPHLSLSHTADLVAVAVAFAGPVGVDLELARAPFEGLDAVAFADVEIAALDDLDRPAADHARVRAWVRKEAVLKATGRGLVLDPREVVVEGVPGRPAVVALPGGDTPARWRLWDVDVDVASGTRRADPVLAAVAVRHDGGHPLSLRVAELDVRARQPLGCDAAGPPP